MSKTIDCADGFLQPGSAGIRGERPEALREYAPVEAPLRWSNRDRQQKVATGKGVIFHALKNPLRQSVIARSALVLMLVALFAALWVYVLRDRLIVKRWGAVVPGVVFRSGQISQYLIKPTLQQHHIKHIICMTSPDSNDVDQQVELAVAKELGIDYQFLPLNGHGVGKVDHFTGAVTSLAKNAEKGEPVLVHCHAGAQRTGGIVAAYRLLIEGRSPEFVIAELRKYGWNPKRDQVLLDFVNAHLKDAAVELVSAGCLEKIPQPLPVLR